VRLNTNALYDSSDEANVRGRLVHHDSVQGVSVAELEAIASKDADVGAKAPGLPPATNLAHLPVSFPPRMEDTLDQIIVALRHGRPTVHLEDIFRNQVNHDVNININDSVRITMQEIAERDACIYIRLMKIFGSSSRGNAQIFALQYMACFGADMSDAFARDCPVGLCNSVEAWSLNHVDNVNFARHLVDTGADFEITKLCYTLLNPCPATATSLSSAQRKVFLDHIIPRWKNSGRLPGVGDMTHRLLSNTQPDNTVALFATIASHFQAFETAKDPRVLDSIAHAPAPLCYELITILFADDTALTQWLSFATFNLEPLSEHADRVLEFWDAYRRRCSDRSFARFVVPFLQYRTPLSVEQKETAFRAIQCVLFVITAHVLAQSDHCSATDRTRNRAVEHVYWIRRKFDLLNNMPFPSGLIIASSPVVETAESWLLDW
jgi:hypothetical protein